MKTKISEKELIKYLKEDFYLNLSCLTTLLINS
jgi:hypothetical protein